MDPKASRFDAQLRGWRTLRGLRPEAIDLSPIALVREAPLDALRDPVRLDALLRRLGLNDEGLDEFPPELHPHCGRGLRIWQYPAQFAPYLADLSGLGVRSYLEVGVRHGGSFVATVEVLRRFAPLEAAVAVDVIPCPAIDAYAAHAPEASFACVNSRSAAFAALLARLGTVDLAFVDSHHDEAQCRAELDALLPHAEMVALHDVSNVGCPGVGAAWRWLRAQPGFECREYVAQYPGLGPFMGIGLAIRARRLARGAAR